MSVELKLVSAPEQISQSLMRFNAEAYANPARALSILHHTWYFVYDEGAKSFGPAKFSGFVGMSFAKYQQALKHKYTGVRFDGHLTRTAIEDAASTAFAPDERLHSKLNEWAESLFGPGIFDGVDESKWKFLRLHVPHNSVNSKQHPEDAAVIAAEILRSKSQGFQSDIAVRQAVEEHAMKRAESHFKGLGYTIIRKGKPYDLHCTKGASVLYVEVKGTQTDGTDILLTPNEVWFANEHRGKLALFVLYGITVSRPAGKVVTKGGLSRVEANWIVDKSRLTPLGYSYELPEPQSVSGGIDGKGAAEQKRAKAVAPAAKKTAAKA